MQLTALLAWLELLPMVFSVHGAPTQLFLFKCYQWEFALKTSPVEPTRACTHVFLLLKQFLQNALITVLDMESA